MGFFYVFIVSFLVIIVFEFGDKIFFIVVIMVMRYFRLIVFSGVLGVLGLMIVLLGVF